MLLWIGGVPPVLSGLVAALVPDVYFQFAGVESVFEPSGYAVAAFILSLQGGDAFVAGTARIIGALYGNLTVKKLLGIVAIAHSCFELWLLPTHFMKWSANYPELKPSGLLLVEVGFFILLHLTLVIGFTWALFFRRGTPEKAD